MWSWPLVGLICGCCVAANTYEGHQVHRVYPSSEGQERAVRALNQAVGHEFDVLSSSRSRRSVDILVPPERVEDTLAYFQQEGIHTRLVVPNLGPLAAFSQNSVFSGSVDSAADMNLYKYHTWQNQMSFVDSIASLHPDAATVDSIGKSHEGRDIKYIKLGYPSPHPKRVMFIDAGIHAREWIAPAMALYAIHRFASESNATYAELLKKIDIIIAPNVNPDGYEFSRTSDRMWRKTRSGPRANGCYGVDPNRNFPYYWAYDGTSANPCSEIFHGDGPLSEVEAQHLAAFLRKKKRSIDAYLTLHSYGENWVYPWGYATHTYPKDVKDMKSLGILARDAIRQVYGTNYTVDNSADSMYPAAGASDDFAKSLGVKYVYTVELRPGDKDTDEDGWYGFKLPERLIERTVREAFEGVLVVAHRVAKMI